MAFVESMAIEVSRATTPDRPIASDPFPRFTYDEAMERFGSDKPDVRFGMELVDLAPALLGEDGQPASGFRVFDEALAAGGRVKAIVAPGHGGRDPRREIDELTELAKRFGAKGLAHLALEDGEVTRPDRQVPVGRRRSGRSSSATAAGEGDLILVVADTPAVTADVLGRLRVELGDRLASPTRRSSRTPGSTASRCTSGTPRTAAGTPPTTRSAASCPRTRRCSSTASGDPRQPVARRSRRPGPRDAVRPRAQRLGARRRLGPDPSARPARAQLPAPGPHARGDAREVRRDPRGVRVRRAAARRHRPRHRPLGGAVRDQTNIREVMAFPKTQSGSDPMLEAPSPPEPGAVRGARPAVRRAAAEGAARRDRPGPGADRAAPGLGIAPLDAIAAPAAAGGRWPARCASRSRGSSTCWAEVSPSTGHRLPRAVRAAAARRSSPWPSNGATARCRGARRGSPPSPGVFFAGDLTFWHHAIEYVGAGLATVLGNLQVLIVGVVAWLVFGERPSRSILLAAARRARRRRPHQRASIGAGAYGADPALGRRPRRRSPRCATPATC